jgi:hypothetical protein
MKIEVVETFSGRPDEAKDFILYLEGAVTDVPDAFGKAMIEKGHAKLAGPAPRNHGGKNAVAAPVPQQTEERPNETE